MNAEVRALLDAALTTLAIGASWQRGEIGDEHIASAMVALDKAVQPFLEPVADEEPVPGPYRAAVARLQGGGR